MPLNVEVKGKSFRKGGGKISEDLFMTLGIGKQLEVTTKENVVLH